MPQIKTSLKELFGLFVQSAQDENLDGPSRQLAARMTVCVAHMQRLDANMQKIVGVGIKLEKKVDDELSKLLSLVSPEAAAAPAAPAGEGAEGGEAIPPDEETAEQMADRIHRETEAEVAAVRAANKQPAGNGAPAQVTPIRSATPGTPTPERAS